MNVEHWIDSYRIIESKKKELGEFEKGTPLKAYLYLRDVIFLNDINSAESTQIAQHIAKLRTFSDEIKNISQYRELARALVLFKDVCRENYAIGNIKPFSASVRSRVNFAESEYSPNIERKAKLIAEAKIDAERKAKAEAERKKREDQERKENEARKRKAAEEEFWTTVCSSKESRISFENGHVVYKSYETCLKEYIAKYPYGTHITEAWSELRKIEAERNRQAMREKEREREEQKANRKHNIRAWAWLSVSTALSVALLWRIFLEGENDILNTINTILVLAIFAILPYNPLLKEDIYSLRELLSGDELYKCISRPTLIISYVAYLILFIVGYLEFPLIMGILSAISITISTYIIVTFTLALCFILISFLANKTINRLFGADPGVILIASTFLVFFASIGMLFRNEYKDYIYLDNKKIGVEFADGKQYRGGLVPTLMNYRGVPNGEGELTHPSGTIEKSLWKNGIKTRAISFQTKEDIANQKRAEVSALKKQIESEIRFLRWVESINSSELEKTELKIKRLNELTPNDIEAQKYSKDFKNIKRRLIK